MPYFRIRASAPVATTSPGASRLLNFLPGYDGRDHNLLYVDYLGSAGWAVRDDPEGRSLPAIRFRRASAVAFPAAGSERIHAFVVREDNHLWDNVWDGSRWSWQDRGAPSATIVGEPSAITDLDGGTRKLHVFMVAQDGHLWVAWMDGAGWHSRDMGAPAALLAGACAAVSFQRAGAQAVHVAAVGRDGHVYTLAYEGGWRPWQDLGSPGPQPQISSVTAAGDGIRRIHVFALCSDGTLWHALRKDGTWSGGWAPLGSPSGRAVARGHTSIVVPEDGGERVRVFVAGADGHLHWRYAYAGSPVWIDAGSPGPGVGEPAAVTHIEGSVRRTHVFATGFDNLPYALWQDGASGPWAWRRFATVR